MSYAIIQFWACSEWMRVALKLPHLKVAVGGHQQQDKMEHKEGERPLCGRRGEYQSWLDRRQAPHAKYVVREAARFVWLERQAAESFKYIIWIGTKFEAFKVFPVLLKDKIINVSTILPSTTTSLTLPPKLLIVSGRDLEHLASASKGHRHRPFPLSIDLPHHRGHGYSQRNWLDKAS